MIEQYGELIKAMKSVQRVMNVSYEKEKMTNFVIREAVSDYISEDVVAKGLSDSDFVARRDVVLNELNTPFSGVPNMICANCGRRALEGQHFLPIKNHKWVCTIRCGVCMIRFEIEMKKFVEVHS